MRRECQRYFRGPVAEERRSRRTSRTRSGRPRPSAGGDRRARYLLIQPDLLHAAVVVNRLVRYDVLNVGPHHYILFAPPEHKPSAIELEALVDLVDQLEALFLVGSL